MSRVIPTQGITRPIIVRKFSACVEAAPTASVVNILRLPITSLFVWIGMTVPILQNAFVWFSSSKGPRHSLAPFWKVQVLTLPKVVFRDHGYLFEKANVGDPGPSSPSHSSARSLLNFKKWWFHRRPEDAFGAVREDAELVLDYVLFFLLNGEREMEKKRIIRKS